MEASWGLGYALMGLDPAAAQSPFAECRDLARAIGAPWYAGASTWGMGTTARYLGQFQQAAALLEHSLFEGREIGNPLGIASNLYSLGQVEQDLGNADRATTLLNEALALFHDHGLLFGVIWCLEALATIARLGERPERAARLLGAAAAVRETTGHLRFPVDVPAYAATVAAVRDALGEQRFAHFWTEGSSYRPAAAIALALTDTPAPA